GLFLLFAGTLPAMSWSQENGLRIFTPEDVHRIQRVGDIAISPDGEWVAYSVGTTNVEKDYSSSDIYMVSWDGETRIQLTHTKEGGESSPRFSPDGNFISFITSRSDGGSEDDDDPAAKSQVWLLNRSGGEARRLTELPGGVSGYEWSPDSTRLVLVSKDPEEEKDKDATHDTPKPIVVDRYRFKQDYVGYLDDRYTRLYVFDMQSKEASLLTPGSFDSTQPAWSPDGNLIAFTSKREGDPDRHNNTDIYVIEPSEGATPRQLTTWNGPDSNPAFSPNGREIAYMQGGPPKYSGYDPDQLAVISVNGGDPRILTGELDRHIYAAAWSRDGRTLHFSVSDDRIQPIVAVPANGGRITRVFPPDDRPGVSREFAVGVNGIAAVASFGQSPSEIYRAADGRALTEHNKELVEEIAWASVERFDAVSDDGVAVGSMLLKPPGYRDGEAYPTIAQVHGGPVGQDAFEFDYISQVLAAQGYLVVNPNYHGSSGRGREFARAIYADWGGLEIQDIHAVMDKLVDDGLADPDRLGIGGWSYGGINTNFAIASDTRFSAAVSGASASNYIAGYGTDQYILQYESELGLPWETPEKYLDISYPFLHADRIKTPTLFMVGELDWNVPLINSEQMYQALRSLNVPTQLIVYPGEHHGLSKPSYIQDRLERTIAWYAEYIDQDPERISRND
ncbi:MAG: S9 family peptidase, partial [Gammaproteobacteria bacterium]|nr:S9 family peptidase [Gammaproteobacteria bacterium]